MMIRRRTRRASFGFALFLLSPLWVFSGDQFYNDWAADRLGGFPAEDGPFDDPDKDGEANLVEFAFGTNPSAGGGVSGALNPLSAAAASGSFSVEVLELQGRQPGVQIDLDLSGNLLSWFRPWWSRTQADSQPADPPGSIRETFTTQLPGANPWFVRSAARLIEAGAEAARYYVATNGSDSSVGTTLAQPFATLSKAAGLAHPGDLIYVRGGTYHWTSRVSLSRSGNPANPIRVRAYPGEHPIFDFSGESLGTRGIEISGHWWRLYGLEIAGAGDNGIYLRGNSNLVELCIFHDCRDSGMQIDQGGSYNLVLNCDSYRNYDPNNLGENADGFAAKFAVGPGNVFHGCRSWENSDDGWDLWQATNIVVIESCWTWRNGIDFWGAGASFAGDGNGIKLGGNYYPGAHRVVNCVSFGNPHTGYDQNNNTMGQTLDNNVAWANLGRNFNLNHGTNLTPHVLRNNLSIAGGSGDLFSTNSLMTHNSWQIITSPAASAGDLLSVDDSFALAPRRDDGGLPETPFLRPQPGGRLVNQGGDVGKPFFGSAPDLGAFETPEW